MLSLTLLMPATISAPEQRADRERDRRRQSLMLMPLNFKKKEDNKIILFIKRYRLYIGLFLFVTVLFALLAPYIFRPWIKYPEVLRSEIAWRYFRASFQASCREDCLAKRQVYASIWRPYYREHPEAAADNFGKALSDGPEELRAALIKIMAADNQSDALPPLLAQAIADDKISAETKRLIVNFFPEYFRDELWQGRLRETLADNSLALSERVYALELLSPFPGAANINALKPLILRVSPEPLFAAACRVLSAWPEDSVLWSEDEASLLADLIISSEKGSLRWRRLWILSSLSEKYPEKISALLSSLAADERLDLISRSLAAEALSSYLKIKIITPDPSARDWQEFYESL